MPNYCSYSMQVTGRPEDVDLFLNEMRSDYCYNEHICEGITKDMRHFCRVFEAAPSGEFTFLKQVNDNYEVFLKRLEITGDCAWSVASCMTSGAYTYYSQFKEKYENRSQATTLQLESRRLNLVIEVYSEETGCAFSEHMLYVNGEEVINDCVDYNEIWYDEDDNELDEPIREGGFDSWDFTNEYDLRIARAIFEKHGGLTTGVKAKRI